jgi:hypothetical protein
MHIETQNVVIRTLEKKMLKGFINSQGIDCIPLYAGLGRRTFTSAGLLWID